MNLMDASVTFDTVLTGVPGIALSVLALSALAFASWRGTGRPLIIGVTLLLYARYMFWRGYYTLNTDSWVEGVISASVFLAEGYGVVQLLFFAYQAWNSGKTTSAPIQRYRSVDIFVPVVNEPLEILRRTLIGCLHQDYPSEKYRVYVLDDGHRDDVKQLAHSLQCGYLRRPARTHAKAGNINHALGETTGELIAIFDTDHVPCASFLRETVGFFDNKNLAFVQTPQHFYNADVFQKNLHLESQLPNEQALFFRVILPGRDAHNSAFFAGSCGVFRRRALMDVGGFQTATITEDIHTSLLVHAKGYQSRYLNKPLAGGLMPESLHSFCKQRIRWATGTMQMLFASNPLTLPGLTLRQRIDYFGSVFYFLFGIPRIVCLIAPLFGLLLSMPVVHATTWDLVHLFGTAYVASLLMMKFLSQGYRGPFWSDIYETAMCFSLAKSVVAALLFPRHKLAFFVTPKGERTEQKLVPSLIMPQLVLFTLLTTGVAVAIQQWIGGSARAGFEVSLFWGILNLLLVTLALLVSLEAQDNRQTYRIKRQLPCFLASGETSLEGTVEDLSEYGALIHLPNWHALAHDEIRLTVWDAQCTPVRVEGRIRRRVRGVGGTLNVHIMFTNVEDSTVNALIALMFGSSDVWSHQVHNSAIVTNLRMILGVFATAGVGVWRRGRLRPAMQPAVGPPATGDGDLLKAA
jgi:cellulose synthase (UDP-forming)